MNIILRTKQRRVIYGFDTLKRIAKSKTGEDCLFVDDVDLNLYVTYLLIHFSDYVCVSTLRGCDDISGEQLERISETIDLTLDDVEKMTKYN